MKHLIEFRINSIFILVPALFFPATWTLAQSTPQALVFIDDPEADVQATDSVSVFKVDNSSGSPVMEEVSFLDAGQMVSLSTQMDQKLGRPTLVKRTFSGVEGEFYEIPIGNNGDAEKLYLNKEDVDVRGFLTGPQNQKNILKESLSTTPGQGPVKVLTKVPNNCKKNDCPQLSIPEGQDIIVMHSEYFLIEGADGKSSYVNYLLAKTPEGKGPFWIEAELTSLRAPDSADEPPCDKCLRPNDPLKDLIDQANELEDQAETGLMTGLVDQLLPHVGQCFKGKGYDGGSDYIKNVLPKLKTNLKVGGRTLNKDQIAAIDLLSRTIYGEMASCHRHGPQYLNTVGRVVLNRAEYIKEEGRKFGAEFGNPSLQQIAPPFGEVILRPYAFSLWNKGDPAGQNAFCPENPKSEASKQETLGGQRRHYQPAVNAYRKALEVAVKAVLNNERLKEETRGVKHLFYTSAIKQGKGFVEAKNVSTPTGAIKNPSCIRLWSSTPIRDRMKKNGDTYKYGRLPERIFPTEDQIITTPLKSDTQISIRKKDNIEGLGSYYYKSRPIRYR